MEKWISYNELAWTEPIVAPPELLSDEIELYCRLIRENSLIEPKTLLHLASGAGIGDYTFKEHFTVTGVDISQGMLEVARQVNPEVTYHYGDMRTVDLGKKFDAVAIPDSIGYMTKLEDLCKTFHTACNHLQKGGVLLITAHMQEEFKANNFVYSGKRGDIEVTVFENNYITDAERTNYEATIIYLIRRNGELEIYTDRHIIGLFSSEIWYGLFKEMALDCKQVALKDLYTPFIMGEGEYPLQIFVCTNTL
jgi:SAM-dependent methyltransferase